MVPTRTLIRPATWPIVASTNAVRSASLMVRNSPVVPRMMIPGTPTAICQSRNRCQAAKSIAVPSAVNGVMVTV